MKIQKLRNRLITDKNLRNEVYKSNNELLKVITINPTYPDCILEHSYYEFKGELFEYSEGRFYKCYADKVLNLTKEGLMASFNKSYKHSAKVESTVKDYYNRNNGKDKIYKIIIFSETKEGVLNAFFKKEQSLSYSSGTSVELIDTKTSDAFKKHFYDDKKGMSRYAALNGNMDW